MHFHANPRLLPTPIPPSRDHKPLLQRLKDFLERGSLFAIYGLVWVVLLFLIVLYGAVAADR
jgi:hypothetical protein